MSKYNNCMFTAFSYMWLVRYLCCDLINKCVNIKQCDIDCLFTVLSIMWTIRYLWCNKQNECVYGIHLYIQCMLTYLNTKLMWTQLLSSKSAWTASIKWIHLYLDCEYFKFRLKNHLSNRNCIQIAYTNFLFFLV